LEECVRHPAALQTARIVLHMAAVTHADAPSEYLRVNTELTKRLLSVCSPRQHFVYVSTICAHPNGGAYGRSKWLAEEAIRVRGAVPAFKGYRNYPKTLCASVNEQVVHGIPSKRKLKEGDIIGLDLGAIVSGFYGDSAVTVPVGSTSGEALRLIQVTEEALYRGIAKAVVGNRLSDVSHAVQSHVEAAGFTVVTEFVGHGIGRQLHEEPQVPNYGRPGQGPRLQVGMVLAIEPMVNMGSGAVRILEDRTCQRGEPRRMLLQHLCSLVPSHGNW